MPGRDIIVVGASAGGTEVLAQLARGLPAALPASIFVVTHFPAGSRSILPQILSRSGPLLATHAIDSEPFYPGHIYVAPPDRHMLLEPDGWIRLTRGPRENHNRPAVDPLFRSAARHFGPRVIGVVLTGALYDGAAGLLAIRNSGGLAVVQDPSDAVVAAMPQNATDIAGADYVVPAKSLAALLTELVQTPIASVGGLTSMDPIEKMPDVVEHDMEDQVHNKRRGHLSVFTCPECCGALWQVDEDQLARFRCHVGHAYNGEALLAEQSQALEAALWTAVRTFKEKTVLARQLAALERGKGAEATAARFEEQASQAERYGELIRRYVLNGVPPEGGEPDVPAPPSTAQEGKRGQRKGT
jgi:two-component system chemotaxis response regulator CheB